jgi:hypothetical protein
MYLLQNRVVLSDDDKHETQIDSVPGAAQADRDGHPVGVRVEIVPPGYDYRLPIDRWLYFVDQDIVPDWYDPTDGESTCRRELPRWAARHIITDGAHTIVDRSVIVHGGTVNVAQGGVCWDVFGGTVNVAKGGVCRDVYGGTVNISHGGYCWNVYGGTVNVAQGGVCWDVFGGTVNVAQGGVCWDVHGGTVNVGPGGYCQNVYGGTVNVAKGGYCWNVQGGTVNVAKGGVCRNVYGGTVNQAPPLP